MKRKIPVSLIAILILVVIIALFVLYCSANRNSLALRLNWGIGLPEPKKTELYAYCEGDPVNNDDIAGFSPYRLYNSSDAAAKDFVKSCNTQTHYDNRERGGMIFRLNVYYRYNPKKRVYRYAYGDIYKGGHNDVVYAFIKERYLFSSMSAKKINIF